MRANEVFEPLTLALCPKKTSWFISLPCLRQETLFYDPGLFHLYTEVSTFSPGGTNFKPYISYIGMCCPIG